MRPGQLTVNEFESALLQRIAEEVPALRPAIDKLHVLSREFTGVGSYTNFKALNPNLGLPSGHLAVSAHIRMPGVPNGLGAELAIENGVPKFLEIFSYGSDHWDGRYDGFVLESNA